MFCEMRRKDRELSRDKAKEILGGGEYGVFSSIGENGYPYGVPVNYIYYDDKIYFHSADEGNKLENIKFNDKVSFTVVSDVSVQASQFSTNYKSVVAYGRASEIEGDKKDEVLLLILEKYSSPFMENGKKYMDSVKDVTKVIEIKIDHLAGKSRNQ